MAQRTVITLVDDITGEEDEDIQTVEFGYKGVTYEVDLGAKYRQILDESLADFIEVARKVGGRQKPARQARAGAGGPPKRDREQTKAIREWAEAQGYTVNPRGRIPNNIEQAYEQAHQGSHLAAV